MLFVFLSVRTIVCRFLSVIKLSVLEKHSCYQTSFFDWYNTCLPPGSPVDSLFSSTLFALMKRRSRLIYKLFETLTAVLITGRITDLGRPSVCL